MRNSGQQRACMDTDSNPFFQALAWYGENFLGSAPVLLAVLGVLLWTLCGGTLGLHLRIRAAGYLTEGRVLGTLSKRRVVTSPGGAPVEDAAQHLAVEYLDERGQTKRALLSEWEEAYAQFAQDHALTLRVVSNPAYDDLYIAQRRGAPKLALAFFVAGSLCMFRLWQSPWLWLVGMLLVVLAGTLSFRFLGRLPAPTEVPEEKRFEPDQIQPMARMRAG